MAKATIADAIKPEVAESMKRNVKAAPVTSEGETAENHGTEVPNRRGFRPRFKNPNDVEEAFKYHPVHIVKLVNLIKSNSDIRRYTALGILNYLYQKGVIDEAKGYVDFKWTKFRVVSKGLSTEYRYVEPFALNCLIASFTSFANAAQKIIKDFCSKEFESEFNQDSSVIEAAVEAADKADNANEE